MSVRSLPVAGEAVPEVPLYAADHDQLLADVWELTRGKLAESLTGGLSWTGKMDAPSWGILADHCRNGAKPRRSSFPQASAMLGPVASTTVGSVWRRSPGVVLTRGPSDLWAVRRVPGRLRY